MNGTQVDGPAARIDIRPARGSDSDAIRAFLAGLSPRTRYFRFFAGVVPATPAMLRRLTALATGGGDYTDALLATEDGVIVGHAMATDTHEASGASVTEVGVVVADARQGRGVGSALMRALASRAQARGAKVILMDVLAENRGMLTMIANHFPAARRDRSGPYVTVHVPLPRHQEEQLREPLSPAREPEPSGPAGDGWQRHVAWPAAARLPVGGSRDLSRCRPSA